MAKCRPITVQGVAYPSVKRCVEALGLCMNTVVTTARRLGVSTEAAVEHLLAHPTKPAANLGRRWAPVVYRGRAFRSWRRCIDALGLSHARVHARRHGRPWPVVLDELLGDRAQALVDALPADAGGLVVFDGVAYASQEACAKAHGLQTNTVRMYAARHGTSFTEALAAMLAVRPVYTDVRHRSVTALSRSLGLSPSTVHLYMHRGLSLEDALAKAAHPSTEFTFHDEVWPSMAACARAHGVNAASVRSIRVRTKEDYVVIIDRLIARRGGVC